MEANQSRGEVVLYEEADGGIRVDVRLERETLWRMEDLRNAIRLAAETASRQDRSGDEAKALLQVVGEYSFALDVLDDYRSHRATALRQAGSGTAGQPDADQNLWHAQVGEIPAHSLVESRAARLVPFCPRRDKDHHSLPLPA
jgi:hypothetical protein